METKVEKHESLSKSKKGLLIATLSIIAIAAAWFATGIATRTSPYHQ